MVSEPETTESSAVVNSGPDARTQEWLTRAELAVSEVRSFREQDMLRFWPGVIRRWVVAVVFALVSAAAGGVGYAWWTKPYAGELASLRSRAEFATFVEHRVLTMTPAERRQFDALMKLKPRGD